MKYLALTALLLIVVAVARPPKAHSLNGYTFEKYVKDHNKVYKADEYARRKAIFEAKLADVLAFNAKSGRTYTKGINHMSDWAPEEFKALNGAHPRAMKHLSNPTLRKPFRASEVPRPPSVDYRNRVPAVLTAVKDQGMCGSCWAHGSTETMESYLALATDNLYVLSQQQVTACAPNPQQCGGTGGCFGSTAELAFEYAVNNGLTQEWNYPYTAYNGTTGTCFPQTDVRLKLSGYVTLPANDQDAVLDVLATQGPLAVNVDATYWSDYESGVFSGCDYSKNITINHVVQLVGYGHDDSLNLDYWIIRNSWSPSYGEHGYIRLLREAQPECGWDIDAQDGYACQGQPSSLWVCGMCGVLGDTSYPIVIA